MIRIAICDDEEAFVIKLKTIVDMLFEEQNIEFQSNVYTNAHRLVNENYKSEYQLIFLDIDMPDISGMEIASKIRAANSEAELIFVSNHSNFVFESFKFSPFRFIRKEYLNDELPEAVEAYCSEYLKRNACIRLTLEDKSTISENITGIVCFFSVRHDIYYSTRTETRVLNSREYTLEKLEEQMNAYGFLRIHKTYLVNYRYIYNIGTDEVKLTLKDSKNLPISHRRAADIRKRYQILMRGGDDI